MTLILVVLVLIGAVAGFRWSFGYYRAKADLEVVDVV